MPRIHVCSLFRVADVVQTTGAKSLVTLINSGTPVERPAAITADRHLYVAISDVCEETDGHVLAGADHVERLIDFAHNWDRTAPLLIHCFAGVSRSTAGAYIAACALNPGADEAMLAERLRLASPTATPNAHLVALADRILNRGGRMIAAIRHIGRGADCLEGEPFALELN